MCLKTEGKKGILMFFLYINHKIFDHQNTGFINSFHKMLIGVIFNVKKTKTLKSRALESPVPCRLLGVRSSEGIGA